MRDDVAAELIAREPILHLRQFVHDEPSLAAVTAPDFWEVGASGRAYTRDVVREEVLRRLATQEHDNLVTQGWTTHGHRLRELAPGVHLLTYVLDQAGRRSRRATIWERTPESWRMIYHQGTLTAESAEPEGAP
ncbi:hypothetical protein BJY21_000276 [Kineosphaera limosa]|uniref:DUF4440 domain-containing protein n=1 Tax=Kineosphaera limosa NBRC 100340 TaxID=1184609 RepID=K6VJZ3_9MICO|nr:hypothetical protein [Kineosphaera limosa]NYD99091.1 hypothetical protein [Kineosphaera limosa]GAB96548.1 hypothetical protein KILIM_041_00020 [Kineosphaera limosa NBRC 100340]